MDKTRQSLSLPIPLKDDFSRPFAVVLPVLAYWAFLLFFVKTVKPPHLILPSVFLFLFYWKASTRAFALFLLPIIATLLVYEGMGYFSHFISAGVHVAEPYVIEKNLFQFSVPAPFMTWMEFWQRHTSPVLDFICGIAYILYAFVFFGFALFLYFSRFKKWAQPAATSFFIVNMMGYLTYYLYPAAPPWYVARFGLGPADLAAHPYAAGALRLDHLLGHPLMENIYSKGSIVFGSLPSLHVSYPFLIIPFAFFIKRFRLPAILFFLLVAFSAVYLNHHYIIDILFGAVYATVAVFLALKFHGPVAQLDRARVS